MKPGGCNLIIAGAKRAKACNQRGRKTGQPTIGIYTKLGGITNRSARWLFSGHGAWRADHCSRYSGWRKGAERPSSLLFVVTQRSREQSESQFFAGFTL